MGDDFLGIRWMISVAMFTDMIVVSVAQFILDRTLFPNPAKLESAGVDFLDGALDLDAVPTATFA